MKKLFLIAMMLLVAMPLTFAGGKPNSNHSKYEVTLFQRWSSTEMFPFGKKKLHKKPDPKRYHKFCGKGGDF